MPATYINMAAASFNVLIIIILIYLQDVISLSYLPGPRTIKCMYAHI